jgi:methionyl-tRNA synthetase
MGKKLETLRNLLYEMDSKKETVFSEGPAPVTQEEKQAFAEAISRYSETVDAMVSERDLERMVEGVVKMVETADRMIAESEHEMLDKINEKRRMRMVNEAVNELKKCANEIVINERRMKACLEDIGVGLNKYY